jgi:outer membrane protein
VLVPAAKRRIGGRTLTLLKAELHGPAHTTRAASKLRNEVCEMKTMRVAAAVAVAALAASAASAQDFTPKAKGRLLLNVRVTDVSPNGDDPITTLAGASTGLKAKVSDDVMPTIGLSYFLTDNIAVEVIAGTTRHTVKAHGAGVDVTVKKSWVLPPVVALQYHFAPQARFSPYVGAGVNYMLFYGGSNENGFHLKLKSGFGTALQAGADYAISGPWSANVDVKKIFFDTRATDGVAGLTSKVKLDPWVISGGIGYRF